jgi:hypothetical protein
MSVDESLRTGPDGDLRDRAIKRLKQRREFGAHLLVYLMVNAFLLAIWAIASPDAFFWPIFPIAGWGIGLVMHAWDVFHGEDISEKAIEREMARLQKR